MFQIIKTIIHDNLKPGSGQACAGILDKRHKGQICGEGVYVTPNIDIATGYAGSIKLGKKMFKLVFLNLFFFCFCSDLMKKNSNYYFHYLIYTLFHLNYD
jgi:hypothetical protein